VVGPDAGDGGSNGGGQPRRPRYDPCVDGEVDAYLNLPEVRGGGMMHWVVEAGCIGWLWHDALGGWGMMHWVVEAGCIGWLWHVLLEGYGYGDGQRWTGCRCHGCFLVLWVSYLVMVLRSQQEH
jgi:hypothetical protein